MGGLTKGLQLIVNFVRFFVWAARSGNTPALLAAAQVGEVWLGEAASAAGIVKGGLPWAMLVGDPFKGSRVAYQNLIAQYGSH